MDTLVLTVKLGRAMRNEDHDAINHILFELEQRLRPEDVALILEGLCDEGRQSEALPEPPPSLTACA